MRYRKRPVVIEAWQWLKDDDSPMPPWMLDAMCLHPDAVGSVRFHRHGNVNRTDQWHSAPHVAINTLEGTHFAQDRDYIIRGVKGELYPCKPDIFRLTYEPVPEEGT